MWVGIVDNTARKMLPILTDAIMSSNRSRFAVAFVSRGGFELIKPGIERCLERGGEVEFLIGLDLTTTEPDAVWSIYELCQENQGASMYCYANLERASVYHPKLYLMNSSEEATAFVGSSNLTLGGLKRNVEINTVVKASTKEEIISDLFDVYNKLKFHPRRVEPDEEFLSLYEQWCRAQVIASRSVSRTSNTKHLSEEFKHKIATLRRPVPTKRDLFGWQKLVYSKLPDGEFSNNDLYVHEDEFRKYYPENRNIRAKIRQKLQELREMGLVDHIRASVWRKRR